MGAEHRRYRHPLRFIPIPSAKELGITFRTGIGISYVTTIRNRHSETVDKALVSRNSVPGQKSPPERVSDSLDYANRWRSPHAEPPSHSDRKSCSTRRKISSPGRGYGCPNIADIRLPRLCDSLAEPTRGAAQSQRSEVVFNLTRDLLPRSWIWVPEHRRYSHPLWFIPTPSAKELGITFRTGIGIVYVTTIRNRHSETVDKALVSRNSRLPRLRESLAEPTRGAAQSQRSEVVFNLTRDLLLRSWIWVPEHRRYRHPLRFIPTPSAKELGITFRTGIRIAYVTTIQNRHSETVDKVLVSRNSVPGPKSPPERVY
ncbi:hypothetical protein Taro_016023 [Colocasia esculenta]|uniref:Uncharacterized protein n=1 Tax=Colocasia esculenta TaxID=4460 RepID=A0A843UJ34_COLES|nr:hypothetical protein [Colocasia esculenta]